MSAHLKISTPSASTRPCTLLQPPSEGEVSGLPTCQTVAQVEAIRSGGGQAHNKMCTLQLAPQLLQDGRWARQLDSTFLTSEFGRLVASITSHGGNVEPVVARPLRDVGSSNLPGKVDRVVGYEIVTGHLRCAASRIASTPVLVTITEIEHEATFLQMLAANQCRQPLSPYEVGVAYDTALKTKLFPDQQSIAEATHIDKSMISEGVRLGRLPDFVVKAFADPRSLQYAFAKPLGDALQMDYGAVERRAHEIRQRPDFESLKPKAVVDLLTGTAARAEQECTVRIVVGSVTVARARLDGSGHFHIAYGQLGADKKATQEFVRRLLRSVESQPLDG